MFCSIFMLSLWWFHYHTSTKGVPRWLIQAVTKPLGDSGYRINVHHATFSFTEGLFIQGLDYSGVQSGIELKAPILYVDFYPLELFKGVSCPVSIVVREAEAKLPILPELEEEGRNDCLYITDLNAEIRGKRGEFEIKTVSANIDKISVQMQGTVNNLLHIILENITSEYWEQNKSGEEWRNRRYPYGFMQMFPIEVRKKFMLSYRSLEEMEMDEKIKCNVNFHIDVNDFKLCEIFSEVNLPEFRYKKFQVHGIREQISLKDGIFKLKEVTIDLGNGASLTAEGTYHEEGSIFSGNLSGDCNVSDLLVFIETEFSDGILKNIVFDNQMLSLDGTLEHFSMVNNKYKGRMYIDLPQIIINGVSLKNLRLNIVADEKKLNGEIERADIENGNIVGTFSLNDAGEFICELKGRANLQSFQAAFPDEVKKFIDKDVSFNRPEEPIEFSGKLRTDTRRKNQYTGQAYIKYPHISLNGIEIKDIETELEFSPERLLFSNISAKGKENATFTGSMQFDLQKQQITAKIIASGIPQNLARSFDTIWQTDSLSPLAKDISSQDSKGIAEADMDLFASYGQKPFYHISGNVVMRNLTYMGLPFQYGAARFITDSNDVLIIPDLILKAKEGSMQLESIYYLKEKNTGDEVLYFNLQSSLKGNTLLKIFADGYAPALVDFPFPLGVQAKGVINYTNQKNTSIRADVQNGSCTFFGAKITDIDTTLHLKNEEIFFNNAEMTFCEGNCKLDFKYNLNTGKGSFKQKLEGADLQLTVQEFNTKELLPPGTGNAQIDFQSRGTFEYKEDKPVLFYGKGQLQLNGANLWTIPVLDGVMKTINSMWGAVQKGAGISSVSCDILFKGEKAVIENFKTDGNIVSLTADGDIHLTTGDYKINMKAKYLKSVLPFDLFSWVLTPVSQITGKEYKGKFNVPENKKK